MEEITAQVQALVGQAVTVLEQELYQRRSEAPATSTMSTLSTLSDLPAPTPGAPVITLHTDVDRG